LFPLGLGVAPGLKDLGESDGVYCPSRNTHSDIGRFGATDE
jgi:hypothetical protein